MSRNKEKKKKVVAGNKNQRRLRRYEKKLKLIESVSISSSNIFG